MLVIDLYKNQNKSICEIAKIAKMSFRDIGFILKKHGLSHGIAITKDKTGGFTSLSDLLVDLIPII